MHRRCDCRREEAETLRGGRAPQCVPGDRPFVSAGLLVTVPLNSAEGCLRRPVELLVE